MIFDRLAAIAATAPATSGLRQGEQFVSYAALFGRIERLAAGFDNRGIGPGDIVALLIPNSPDLFAVSHALFAIGAVAMPLGPTATVPELVALATKTGLTAFIATPALAPTAGAVIASVAPSVPLFLTTTLSDLERAPITLPKLSGSTNALYLFSSGSTGLPKIVPHTHAEILADGDRTSTAWGLEPDDLMVNILPPNFAMGFFMATIDAPSRHASTFYWGDPLPLALSRRKLLEAMAAHRVTTMGAVPAMYEIISAQTGAVDISLRFAFSAGAAAKRSTYDGVQSRFGIPLRQVYGSTEAIMVSCNNAADADATWASVGEPAGDVEVKLAPPETDLGPGIGELLLKSSSLMQGYLGDAAANAQAFDDGWFRSGDLASIDDEGRIFIRGRSKLLIEVSGYKIDPIEVEDVIGSHPSIAEIAIDGVADPRTGNRLRAYIVRRADIGEDEIIRHARAKLSVQKVPAEFTFIDALPRSPTGKLLRARLKEL